MPQPDQLEMFSDRIGVLIPTLNAMAAVFVTEQPTARTADPVTSQKAGRLHPIKRGGDRARVLLAHAAHPGGLTDFELAEIMQRQQTSAGKRRLELQRACPAYVEDTGLTRVAPSGSPATVYRITDDGRQMARILSVDEG